MRHLVDAALARRRATLALLLILLCVGWGSMLSIPKESTPDVQIPIVYVTVGMSGISPEDSERLLVRPLENKFRQIEGVKEMTASAYSGGGFVQMEFVAGYDIDKALEDTRIARDEAKADLPDDADEPTVHEVNLSLFPIVTVTLSSSLPERALRQVADNLADAIETLPNVLSTDTFGTLVEQVEVILDPEKLESYNVDTGTVLATVSGNNRIISAGTLDTGAGRFAVRVPGLYTSANDVLSLPVRAMGDRVVTISDIATLRSTFQEPNAFARVNGESSVSIEVSKRIGTNIIETIDQIKEVVERESESWPPGVSFSYNSDQSLDIRNMLNDLGNTVVTSILLVVIVLIATIGLRSALLVGFAIPASLLVAFLVLNGIGFTVNIVVLFSLILSVGLLVDGSIVMTEFADRKMAEGETPERAFQLASHRMFWPITSSTATTLCAFLPLAFWPGIVGEFMKYMPITQVIVLTTALFMALIFLPVIGSLVGRKQENADETNARAIAHNGDLSQASGMTAVYVRFLGKILQRPALVLLAAFGLLVAAQFGYARFGAGVEFFPDIEPERAIVQIHARGNLSAVERDGLVREVEEQVLALAREKREMFSIYALSRASGGRDRGSDVIGSITVEFTDFALRRPAEEILQDLRDRTNHLAGIRVEVEKEEGGPPAGDPLLVRLTARDSSLLPEAARRVSETMASIEGVIDIENTLPPPELGLELEVDRAQAQKFGADLRLVGRYVELFTEGLKLASYRPDHTTKEVDIIARLPVDYRTVSQLERLRIKTDRGLVPLSSFVRIESKPTESLLRRVNQLRVVEVSAKTAIDPNTGKPYLPATKQAELAAALESAGLDPQVRYTFAGEDEERRESSQFLIRAFLIALSLMAVILVTQFNSFFSALLVLSAVIMSTTGVMIGLILTGQPFGIVMCGIGVIALAGIIVNNNIVLIDAYNTLRAAGESGYDAVLRAGAQRLRPVLLTAVTTTFGLLPLVLQLNINFLERDIAYGTPSTQWWVQLSTVIVFGLLFATPLTLLVTPSALVYKARMEDASARRRQAKMERAQAKITSPTDKDEIESGLGPAKG